MEFEEAFTKDGFWCFEQRGVRCFLLEGSEEAVLIDTCYGGALPELCRSKTDKPLRVVLTHGDKDHIGGLGSFGRFRMHPAEEPYFRLKNGDRGGFEPLSEGDRICVGDFCLEALHIPGHTPGSVALIDYGNRFAICGDSVQIGPVYMFGYGRNMEDYRASMKKLDRVRGGFDRVYSSHNQLTVPPDMIPELYDYAGGILSGALPEPLSAPEYLPETVKLYEKGRAAFYLDVNELERNRNRP